MKFLVSILMLVSLFGCNDNTITITLVKYRWVESRVMTDVGLVHYFPDDINREYLLSVSSSEEEVVLGYNTFTSFAAASNWHRCIIRSLDPILIDGSECVNGERCYGTECDEY